MKKQFVTLLAVAGTVSLLGSGQAVGSAARTTTAQGTVTVVMRDPGCHWFAVGGKYLTRLTVKGPVGLKNDDMAALKVASARGTKLDRVGKTLALARGTYRITMVGQAPDDNTLRLLVR
jgi:hypothetical protein